MAVKFRPRVGPFVWVGNGGMSRGVVALIAFYIKAALLISFVWPLQLIWFVLVWTVKGIVLLVQWASAEYAIRTQAKV